jgi:hypothetical protein
MTSMRDACIEHYGGTRAVGTSRLRMLRTLLRLRSLLSLKLKMDAQNWGSAGIAGEAN